MGYSECGHDVKNKGERIKMKQKFYETVDRYLMAMGINIEEYYDLKELTLNSFAV